MTLRRRCPTRLRRLSASVALALFLLALPTATPRSELVAALSNHLVAITTGFSGTEVLLFGAIDDTGDVVVIVRGPESTVTVHRKGRSFGVWVNEANLQFAGVPGFWAIAASRPIADAVLEPVADFHQMGLAHLRLQPLEPAADRRIGEFRQALIRNKEQAGLYRAEAEPITFLGNRLFRTDLWIPANAPMGTYTVSVFLVRDGDVVNAQTTPLVVGRVGFEARVFSFAGNQSLLYGLLAVLLAAMAGWLANVAFRQD